MEHHTEEPNDETLQALWEAEHGIGLSKAYTDIDELMKDLLNDDDDEVFTLEDCKQEWGL